MKSYFTILFFCVFSAFLSSCKNPDKKNKTPEAYDLNNPEKFIMPGNLLEISGICFDKGDPDTLFAIQDEEGKFFRTVLGKKDVAYVKFGRKGDYEDVALIGEKVYILRSDGTIFSFNKTGLNQQDTDSVQEWKALLPEGEFEGMFGDASDGKLYIVCKECKRDDNKKVSGFVLDIKDTLAAISDFSIDVAAIQAFTKKSISGFKPSALAKNPVTGEWFILSGSDKLLVIADSIRNVKAVYPLSGKNFNQAEGIAFDREGNLYISNEGNETANGNVLKFVLKKKIKPD